MKTAETKAKPTARNNTNSGTPFFQREAAGGAATAPQTFFNAIQPKLTVSPKDDPHEQQADRVADHVVSAESKVPFFQTHSSNMTVQRSGLMEDTADIQEKVQRSSESLGSNTAPASFESGLRASKGGGSKLPDNVRGGMESSIGADFSGVRVHTGSQAASLSNQISAKAFANESDVYFNEGEYAPETTEGKHLLAHELTHTVQQGAAVQASSADIKRSPVDVQRIPDWILEELNDYARYIPGWTLFTVIIGFNPLLGRNVDRNAQNLVQGLLELIPVFGVLLYSKLNELGVLQEAFDWVNAQLSELNLSLSRLERTIEQAWDDVSLVRGLDYNIGVLERTFGGLYNDVMTFASRVGDKILQIVKGALVSFLKSFVDAIPGYTLLTKIIGKDPLTDEPVEASTAEIIADFLRLIGAERELQKMEEEGTLQETADWIDEQLALLNFSFEELKNLFIQTWDSFSFEDVRDPVGAYQRVADIWSPFLTRVGNFAYNVATKVVEFIKNALLSQLRLFALDVRGYHLLTVLVGKDPFTGENIPRNVENIIRGFMSLMEGGEQQFQEMKQSGAIQRTTDRINAAVAQLGFTWAYITGLFMGLWNSFTIDDIFNPLGAFQRIIDTFANPVLRLIRFIVTIVKIVIEVLLEVMQFPVDVIVSIIARVQQAWESIKRDPIGFIKNLLRSVKLGFQQFFDNIGQHLLNGLTGWLFGELAEAGISPPPDLSLKSILQMVMQVLGITVDRIWQKLGEHIGQERVERIRSMIDRLTGIWSFVREVIQDGPAAIWRHVSSFLSNLWDMVFNAVKSWVMERIIGAVVTKLMSMLDPTGIMAVINSFIAIYRAIQSFIRYLTEMLHAFNRFVGGVLAVAQGNLMPAASKLEESLASIMPIAIGFLANQVGLGGIGRRIGEMIAVVRQKVDEALDWLIGRAVSTGSAVLNALLGRGNPEEAQENEEQYGPEKAAQIEAGLNAVRTEENRLGQDGKISREQADQVAAHVRQNHPVFTSFVVIDGGDSWNYRYAASPEQELDTSTGKAEGDEGGRNTDPQYGGTQHGFGKSATVEFISQGHMPGTEANSNLFNTNYEYLNKRLYPSGAARFYIRGHLLNNNLGGPGSDWENLTPLKGSKNGEHLRNFESYVKTALTNGEQIKNFEVTALYGRGLHQNAHELINGTRDFPELENKEFSPKELGEVMIAEQYVPTRLICSAIKITEDNGESPVAPSSPIYIDQSNSDLSYGNVASYNLGNISRRQRYNLKLEFDRSNRDRDDFVSKVTSDLGVNNGIAESLFDHFFENNSISGHQWQQVMGVTKTSIENSNPDKKITGSL